MRLILCLSVFICNLYCYGMEDREQSAAYANYKEKLPNPLNIATFAQACLEKEGTGAQIIEISRLSVKGSRGGVQNTGIYKARTNDNKTYVVKHGHRSEFPSSKKLHGLIQTKDLPDCVKFAYPRYMQTIVESSTGKRISINTEGVPVDGNSAEVKCEVDELIGQPSPLWTFNDELPDENEKNVLLFMDYAPGIPGDVFVSNSNTYPKEQLKLIFKNLALSVNTLHGFICPDDSQNAANLIVSPENAKITYIDIDKLHFYEGDVYRSLSGQTKNFDWYWSMLDRQDMDVKFAFYENAIPPIQNLLRDRIWVRPPAFVDEIAPDQLAADRAMRNLKKPFPGYEKKWDKHINTRTDRRAAWTYFKYVGPVIDEYYGPKDKEANLARIKENAAAYKTSPEMYYISKMNLPINVQWSEFYMTEDELWCIWLTDHLTPEEKDVLSQIYLRSIPKPLLYTLDIPDIQVYSRDFEKLLTERTLSRPELEGIAAAYKKYHTDMVVQRDDPYGTFYETKIKVVE